jgi:hypothetical protein
MEDIPDMADLHVGDILFAYTIIKNGAGTQTDSNDVAFKTLRPSGTVTTETHRQATSTDLSEINTLNATTGGWTDLSTTTGVYVSEVNTDEAGAWWWQWIATDPIQYVDEGTQWIFEQQV